MINPNARRAVYARSEGTCERCHKHKAVHVHHLTYERAGEELLEDLQHICIDCHMAAHPKKAWKILLWEMARQARLALNPSEELETDLEQSALEELEEPEEPEPNKRPWNLGHYRASAYCIEDVEAEEAGCFEPPKESAWNLGNYEANAYCLEDVEREECDRKRRAR